MTTCNLCQGCGEGRSEGESCFICNGTGEVFLECESCGAELWSEDEDEICNECREEE